MDLMPPSGSKILVTESGADSVITIPQGSGGPVRYFVGLFLLFWLGGWVAGFGAVTSKLWSGGLESLAANGVLVLWLGGWTLAGAFAMFYLYKIFRPSVPESLRLMPDSIAYDSGVPPFQLSFSQTNQKEVWKNLFSKRLRVELDRQQLQSLRLRETDSGNRLTMDANTARLDVARSVGDVEREWLYQLLAGRYLKSSAPGSASVGKRT